MKTKLLITLFFASINLITAQNKTSIPDENFEKLLIEKGIDSDGIINGEVLTSDINTITQFSISIVDNIRDLTGIGGFTALKTLNLQDNYLPSLNFSQNTNLESLSLSGTETKELNINNNTKLKELGIYGSLDDTAVLNISNNINLTKLFITRSQLTALDISSNTNLVELNLQTNQLTSLDVSKNINLIELNCSQNNMKEIEVSNLMLLEQLDIFENKLTQLDLSNNLQLTHLDIQKNQLTSLDLKSNVNLRFVRLQENALTFVDIKNGNNTNISVFRSINNPALACIKVDNKNFSDNSSNWRKDATSRYSEECKDQTYIADTNFENYLEFKGLGNGENNDNSVDTANISGLTVLDISDENISDLTGIEAFVSLVTLDASVNSITTLDLSKNINLEILNLAQNPTTAIDVSNNTKLTNLNVSGNQLKTLDVTKNTALTILDTKLNELTTIDLTKNIALKELNIGSNKLSSLDLSKLVYLERLDCFSSELASIDIHNNKKLYYVDLSGNKLENIDLYGNIALGRLKVNYNKLKYIDIQNNTNLVELNVSFNELIGANLKNSKNSILFNVDISNNPNLTCTEVDNVSFSSNNWSNKDAQTSFSTDCAPVNDNCSNAIPLTFGQPTPGDVISGNSNSNAACVTGTVIADVWFSIIVPQTKEFKIQGTAFGGKLKFAVYNDCAATNTLACGEDISLTNLTVGDTLYLKVWLETTTNNRSTKSENGTFTITAEETNVLSVNNYREVKNQYSIYPNPTSSNFTISSENSKIQNIKIYNYSGKKVLDKNVENKLKLAMNVSAFSAGIYLIKIKSENKITSKKLIIK